VQERLTMQIASALTDVIHPAGVGVVVEATSVITHRTGPLIS